MPKSKKQQYRELVAARKTCEVCRPELTNPSHVKEGKLDSDRLGPYSLWQGNIDSQVLVIAQDFADITTFQSGKGWPGEVNRTNLTLVELAAAAGLDIAPPKRNRPDNKLFFTNAVLCLKQGNMQSMISSSCFRECGERFLRPTIELIKPKAVVSLGTRALDATLRGFGLSRSGGLISLIEAGKTFSLPCGATLFPMCHPSQTVLNTRRSLEHQTSDWKRLGRWLKTA